MEITKRIYTDIVKKYDEESIVVIRQPEKDDRYFHVGISPRQDLPIFLTGKSLPEDLDNPEEYYPYAERAFDELSDYIPLQLTYDGRLLVEFGTGFTDNYGDETTELTFITGDLILGIAILQHILDSKGVGIYLYDEDCLNGVA